MTAGIYNFTIEKGATFSKVLTWKDSAGALINLMGFTARMHIRTSASDATTIIELTTGNARIALGGAAGTVTLSITDEDTTAITAASGVYDLELESAGGEVTRLLSGHVTFTNEVTR